LGCPPPLHAQVIARGPLSAVRLHQSVGSGTARAAVRHRRYCLHLAFMLSQVSPSESSTSQYQQSQHLPKSVIPTQSSLAHQELGALQGPASALCRHAFRGTAPASPFSEAQGHSRGANDAMMIVLLLFLQKQSLAFNVYLFGICTLLTGPGLKKNTCDNALTMTSLVHW
jgi:hypothetical protein